MNSAQVGPDAATEAAVAVHERYCADLVPRLPALELEGAFDGGAAAPEDALKVLAALNDHRCAMRPYGLPFPPDLDDYEDALAVAYLDDVQATVIEWVTNVRRRAPTVVAGSDGRLRTPQPEDMLRLAREQLRAALDLVTGPTRLKAAVAVAEGCAAFAEDDDEDDEARASRVADDGDDGAASPLEVFAARCNDCARASDLLLGLVDEDGQREALERDWTPGAGRARGATATELLDGFRGALEATVAEFAAASARSVDGVCDLVLSDLEAPMAEGLFSEADHGATVETVAATLADYGRDLEQWLESAYFARALEGLLSRVAARYVDCLCDAEGHASRLAAAKKRPLDAYAALVAGDADALGAVVAQFETTLPPPLVARALAPLRAVAAVVAALRDNRLAFPGAAKAHLHGPFGPSANDVARALLALDPALSKETYDGLKGKLDPPPGAAAAPRKRTRLSVVAAKNRRFPNMARSLFGN